MSMRWRQKSARVAKVAIMLALLAGCSNDDNTDLQAYIDEVKASAKGRITPLPEFVPVSSFTYSADGYGDPFMSWETKALLDAKDRKQTDDNGGLQPDLGRRREALEAFPLDTLRMV
ncbi:MAG TPA: pilus assembly protein PilP, partial [Candidatus Tenderia electrophaga]|nr:pilus assembly protein PilP [Candidatus Tenderia electrophaga]